MEKVHTQHVHVWEEEWTVFIKMSLLGTGLYSTFTSGKKSGRLFHEMTLMVILRFHP